MQIVLDRQTTRCSSELLPGGWKLEIFGTKGKCLIWCWSHNVLQGRAFGKGVLISGACLAPSLSPAIVKDEQWKNHLGSAGCTGSSKRNPPNRRKKRKIFQRSRKHGEAGRRTCRKDFYWEKQEALQPIFSNMSCFFLTAPFDRSHFPAIFSYICDLSFWYLLFM